MSCIPAPSGETALAEEIAKVLNDFEAVKWDLPVPGLPSDAQLSFYAELFLHWAEREGGTKDGKKKLDFKLRLPHRCKKWKFSLRKDV